MINRGPYIQTFTGKQFHLLSLNPDELDIRDIAHALAHINRFTGHARHAYSVGEHSIRCSQLAGEAVNRNGGTRQDALYAAKWGLLHDASEAYMQDIATPLKRLPGMEGYRALEKKVQSFIVNHFGLGSIMPDAVKLADEMLVNSEADELLPGGRVSKHGWPDRPSLPGHQSFGSFSAAQVESYFLRSYEALFNA